MNQNIYKSTQPVLKEVENLYHFTKDINTLKAILKDGFKPSYSLENIGSRDVLIPMISFMNVLLRDVGSTEVVHYGNFGIGIKREFAIKLGINPVSYFYEKSIMESAILSLQDLSILPQLITYIKKDLIDKLPNFTQVTNHLNFNPKPIKEVEDLLNSLDKNTNDNLIESITNLITKIHENVYSQIIISKPYKVKNKNGDLRIAYNEREWRKGFPELGYILKKNIKGEINPIFENWSNTQKPHFKEKKYRLQIDLENINEIIVEQSKDIQIIYNFLLKQNSKKKIDMLIDSGSLRIEQCGFN